MARERRIILFAVSSRPAHFRPLIGVQTWSRPGPSIGGGGRCCFDNVIWNAEGIRGRSLLTGSSVSAPHSPVTSHQI